MKKHEVDDPDPEYLCYIVILEANASVKLKTVKGLWRNKKMTDYIKEQKLLPVDVIDYLWARWDTEERRVNNKSISAEEVLKQEAKLALRMITQC